MTRTALVTGAVTGIGAATAKKLKAAGYAVIANHYGTADQARAFQDETGIPVREFDVADFRATQAAIDRPTTPRPRPA